MFFIVFLTTNFSHAEDNSDLLFSPPIDYNLPKIDFESIYFEDFDFIEQDQPINIFGDNIDITIEDTTEDILEPDLRLDFKFKF